MTQDVELSKQLLKLTRGFHAYNLAVHPQGLDLGGLADDEIAPPLSTILIWPPWFTCRRCSCWHITGQSGAA
jgi:hypothetical protein